MRLGEGRGDTEAYLIEMRSIGGISGSPVFIRESLWLEVDEKGKPLVSGENKPRPDTKHISGGGKSWLFGVMQGHWDMPASKRNELISPDSSGVNVGIALVMPAKRIAVIVNDPALVAMREKEIGLLHQRFVPNED